MAQNIAKNISPIRNSSVKRTSSPIYHRSPLQQIQAYDPSLHESELQSHTRISKSDQMYTPSQTPRDRYKLMGSSIKKQKYPQMELQFYYKNKAREFELKLQKERLLTQELDNERKKIAKELRDLREMHQKEIKSLKLEKQAVEKQNLALQKKLNWRF